MALRGENGTSDSTDGNKWFDIHAPVFWPAVILIAAMIIGAAMLMSVPSPFIIFGYPGLAILFFMLAALAGIYLSYTILFKDE